MSAFLFLGNLDGNFMSKTQTMKSLYLFFAFCFFPSIGSAYHKVAGLALSYEQVSNGVFDVYISIYRQCDGAALGASYLIATCSSSTITVLASQQTLVSVKKLNSCQGDVCQGSMSFEEHIWKARLDLTSAACCEWTLQYANHFRESNGSSGEVYFVSSMLNRCLQNGGGTFVELPRLTLQSNTNQFLNFRVKPGAGIDSVSYQLVNGQVSLNQYRTYSGQYSAIRPMRFFGFPNTNLAWPAGFRLSESGMLMFRPTQVNEVGSAVVRAYLWKRINGRMEVVGTLIRDIEPVVFGGYNIPPNVLFLTEKEDTSDIYYCAGDTAGFVWQGADLDGDSTYFEVLSADSGISWTLFYDKNAQAKLKVFVPGSLADTASSKTYSMDVRIKDNHCPFPGSSRYLIRMRPSKKPKANFVINQQCRQVDLSQQVSDSVRKEFKSSWVLYDSNNTLLSSNPSGLFQQSLVPGNYYLFASQGFPAGCGLDTSFNLSILPNFRFDFVGEDSSCFGDSIKWVLVNSGIRDSFNYTWANLTLPNNPGFLVAGNEIALFPSNSSEIRVDVTDSSFCSYSYSKVLHVFRKPVYQLLDTASACAGDSIDLGPHFFLYGNTYKWDDSSSSVPRKVIDTGWYGVSIYGHPFCVVKDRVYAKFHPTPKIQRARTDTLLCSGTPLHICTNGGTKPYQYTWNSVLGDSVYLANKTESIFLEIMDTNGCDDTLSFRLTVPEKPNLSFNPPSGIALCPNDSLQLSLGNLPKLASLHWSDSVGGQFKFVRAGSYILSLMDSSSCFFKYSYQANAHSLPISSFSYSQFDSGYLFAPALLEHDHLWLFGDGDSSLDISPFHVYKTNGNYLVNHFVMDTITKCTSKDTLGISVILMSVLELENAGVKVYPNPFSSELTLDFAFSALPDGIRLFDLKGQEILIRMEQNLGQGRISGLENLQAGTYIIAIDFGYKRIYTRLQKKN